jgi:tetratricopeptide (TPR) repeat protein
MSVPASSVPTSRPEGIKMREDEQEEAKLWEKVASPDGDTKVDALLQLSYNAAGQQEYTEVLAFCETARETYEALGALASSMKMAHIYFGIGHCLRHLNRSADAAIALEKSVELYQEVGSEDALHILNEEVDKMPRDLIIDLPLKAVA